MILFGYTFIDKILGRSVCDSCNGRGVISVEKPPAGQQLEDSTCLVCGGAGYQ